MFSWERKFEKHDPHNIQEEIKAEGKYVWRPISLRLPFLTFVLLSTSALIVVLQWLLFKSQTTGGILFAPSINDLPLSKTFGYLYAPTIIAVVYGLLWSWIDLDIKRMEPYYQLCSPSGALAEDSLLLQYPFDFVALVPFKAARRKQWSVLTAALAGIIVLWTLIPLQAGILATEKRVVTTTAPFLTSTSYQPASDQSGSSAVYAQHAYNIAWLNEKLPPYSTIEFVLDAFAPAIPHAVHSDEVWNGTTKLYSVDVICEPTISYISNPGSNNPNTKYNSSSGCSYGLPVKTGTGNDTSKTLESMYVGYSNQNGMADWYLEGYCPKQANHTFLVRTTLFSEAGISDQNLASTTTPDSGVLKNTSLYCEPRYYEQRVNASVAAANGSVIKITPVGQKTDLPREMFDINLFERAMSSGLDYSGPGKSYESGRGNIPENGWPDQKAHFTNTNLDMSYLPKMVPFSFAALKRPTLEDYLEPEILAESYQAAYRLLFVAQMARVLKSDFKSTATLHDGQITYHTQALVLVPGFTYVVEALLVLGLLFNLSIIYFSLTRTCNLRSDPMSIASHMSATADDPKLLALFGNLAHKSAGDLRNVLVGSRFSLSADAKIELQSVPVTSSTQRMHNEQTANSKGFQSPELRWYSGFLFLAVQLTSITVFAYLFRQAKANNGLALPSESRFVRQLLEKYIPTAIATTLEPVWILLTRQICALQPFEELRKGKASSKKSIALAYTNLPPQLVVFKSFRNGHIMLGLLATMTILANVLSVALSSLFFEETVNVEVRTSMQPSLSLPFQSLNGTAPPFNSNVTTNWQGGTTKDEFYIAMSNAVASSKLPSWTEPERFYFPVALPASSVANINYTVTTSYFGASLECQGLTKWEARDTEDKSRDKSRLLEFNVPQSGGSTASCSVDIPTGPPAYISGSSSLEISSFAGPSDLCKQKVVGGWWRGKAKNQTVEVTSTTMILCQPKLVTGSAKVTVDSNGQILHSKILNSSNGSAAEHFTTSPSDLILQAHQFIIDQKRPNKDWHNDSFPSDWTNYLIYKTFTNTGFLDPEIPAPTFIEAIVPYTAIYNTLFAILLGNNAALLLSPPASNTPLTVTISSPQPRIFLSTPAFLIAQTILCIYALTTISLYLHRPWRILPRSPISIASTIAYFAAGYAIAGFEGSSGLTRQEMGKWIKWQGYRWAYGKFVGRDGRVHVGVEREPFVQLLEKRGDMGI